MKKNAPRRRRARALLVASSGLAATLLLSGCPDDGPFGNLKIRDLGNPSEPRKDLAVEDLTTAPDDASDKD